MTDRSGTPTKEELEQLPCLAVVAFAARCARRVQPLFDVGWPRRGGAPEEHSKAVEKAITLVADFAAGAEMTAAARAAAAMRRDFDLLRAAAKDENWTDETPVRQEFFGPLWLEGGLKGWLAEESTSEGCELVFEMNVPNDMPDEEVIEIAQKVAKQADKLHRAYGGHGLKVKGVEVFGDVPVHEGVTT
jgi:hypothetical protein